MKAHLDAIPLMGLLPAKAIALALRSSLSCVQAHGPIHISKTVLSIVKIGPPHHDRGSL